MAATTLAISAGNNQVAPVSTLLATALAVLVTDGTGNPVSGQAVAWKVQSGGGAVTSGSSNTNASGIATMAWTLGATAGTQLVSADVAGLAGAPALFYATATPTLATLQNFKDLYRIQTTAEDGLIADLLTRAAGEIEGAAGVPLGTRVVTWYDDAVTLRLFEAVRNLIIPYGRFIDATTVVVKDQDSTIVPAANYMVRLDRGLIMALPGLSFAIGFPASFPVTPYSVTATVGFGTSSTYTTVELPQINNLILSYAGMLYQQRTPGASSEKSAGSTVTYKVDPATGLPDVIARGVRRLRGIVVAA